MTWPDRPSTPGSGLESTSGRPTRCRSISARTSPTMCWIGTSHRPTSSQPRLTLGGPMGRSAHLPALLAGDLVDRHAAAGAVRCGQHGLVGRIAEREKEIAATIIGKTEETAREVQVVDGGG